MRIFIHLLAILLALLPPAGLAQAPAPAPPSAARGSDAGWLYAGSDLPPDPAWRLGVLPNGLRYAVRRNALPAGTVSIRLRIDAGALMERPDEKGYAHFLEHMVFRGSAGVPDGEGVRTWQRLGASFGSDSNAFTTLSQTFYALDLPRSDATSLDLAMAMLAGMMTRATIDPALVDVERKVVLAERDARMPPLTRRTDAASKRVFYAGLAAADAELAGTEETLAQASAARLRAFYERWYRPERATLVMVGDADPDLLVRVLTDRFGGWQGKGSPPPEPDFGRPETPDRTSDVIVDPQASNLLTFLWAKPHDIRPWTIQRQSNEYARQVAARILGRRLTRAARSGAPFTSAAVSAGTSRATMDATSVTVANRQTLWRPAMDRVFSILAQGVEAPPSQDEIDREIAVIEDSLAAAISARATIRSADLANQLNGAIDSGLPVISPQSAQTLFSAIRPRLTPAAIGAAMRDLTQGEPRALMMAPVAPEGGQPGFAAALDRAREAKAEARVETKAVRFADLGKPPAPGREQQRTTIADLGITRVRFANGVELIVKPTDFEKDRILVSVTVGHGMAGLPTDRPSPTWTASAILQGGIGPFDLDAMERLVAGRRIRVGFGVDEDGFDYGGSTNARDLPDTLRLIATAIAEPRFDAGALGRLKGQLGGTYESIFATPGGVYGAFASQPLHSGDPRWAYPGKAAIMNLPLEEYRAFWTPILAQGPRRVTIVGDVTVEAAVDAVAATLGAAVTRPAPAPSPAQTALRPPRRTAQDVALGHRGDPAQSLTALVWSTDGALTDLDGTRALNVTAAILRTRLFDRFRESEGGTYSPGVGSSQSQVFPNWGLFVASSQLRPERRADFTRAAREEAADLARRGPSADELTRAVTPIVSGNERNMRTNAFWAGAMSRDLDDPRVLRQIRTTVDGYRAVTAQQVKAAARKWLTRAPSLTVTVAGPAGPAGQRAAR